MTLPPPEVPERDVLLEMRAMGDYQTVIDNLDHPIAEHFAQQIEITMPLKWLKQLRRQCMSESYLVTSAQAEARPNEKLLRSIEAFVAENATPYCIAYDWT